MAPAAAAFAEELAKVEWQDAQVPVYCNVDGAPHTAAEELQACLRRQLAAPVRWEACVRAMIAAGAREFWELGPKKVLTNMLARIDPAAQGRAIGTWEELSALA
jgi:[acyl-carrier-protein] S-malonyltransferase